MTIRRGVVPLLMCGMLHGATVKASDSDSDNAVTTAVDSDQMDVLVHGKTAEGAGDCVVTVDKTEESDSGVDDSVQVSGDQQPLCQQFRMHIREANVDMWLLNSEVWELLHPFGHEMLINTSGRYMRPDVRVEVRGLQPEKLYHLRVRISAISPIKMSFRRGRWEYSTNEAAADISVVHEHPDSPRSGQFWLDSFIIFDAIKLYSTSASDTPTEGGDGSRLVLEPRRKYQVIIELEEALGGELHHFEFEQLQFISVTAWHSAAVKNYKVKPHQYANPTRTRPVDEVDAALGARAVPPTFQVLDERGQVVRGALNPHAVNILCKPPQAHGSARVHKLGIIHDAGISAAGGDGSSAPALSAPSGHETQRALRLLHEPSANPEMQGERTASDLEQANMDLQES
ncbi:T-box protein 1-like [Varroa jacobsoni]|uniref:T-box domain-containing protein n=1 Tax=Varroa destructor TaxID=109461 RepID=A0A7M7KEX4_VARDE|nr:T-box protein 1-like [Varroa destructor]XP_022664803.1 T-box protein 1-like [Varroa destructor]XP_022664891.1 T-box protein 1-like [Varroa destructor]XP_022699977.1 T-box protein 1-like [Varroa jacobsoni]